ncbi:phosphotransferase, partial [Acinetobacter baumannii]
ARLDLALAGFRHPAENHDLLWDLKRADRVRGLLAEIPDAERRALPERALDRFVAHVLPVLPALRTQVIHNDFNPHNVLAGATADDEI